MRGHDFMLITEMENRNAHDVLEWTIENFRFTTSTTTSTRKCLRTLQTNSVILCMLNGCSVLAARKSLQSVTNELDKLKL